MLFSRFRKRLGVTVFGGDGRPPSSFVLGSVEGGSTQVRLESPADLREHALHCMAAAEIMETAAPSLPRRIINQGGVKLEGEAVVDLDPPAERISGRTLKVGKKREVRVP